jgi:hypothetical protein
MDLVQGPACHAGGVGRVLGFRPLEGKDAEPLPKPALRKTDEGRLLPLIGPLSAHLDRGAGTFLSLQVHAVL